jgi:hypothetical protein
MVSLSPEDRIAGIHQQIDAVHRQYREIPDVARETTNDHRLHLGDSTVAKHERLPMP